MFGLQDILFYSAAWGRKHLCCHISRSMAHKQADNAQIDLNKASMGVLAWAFGANLFHEVMRSHKISHMNSIAASVPCHGKPVRFVLKSLQNLSCLIVQQSRCKTSCLTMLSQSSSLFLTVGLPVCLFLLPPFARYDIICRMFELRQSFLMHSGPRSLHMYLVGVDRGVPLVQWHKCFRWNAGVTAQVCPELLQRS